MLTILFYYVFRSLSIKLQKTVVLTVYCLYVKKILCKIHNITARQTETSAAAHDRSRGFSAFAGTVLSDLCSLCYSKRIALLSYQLPSARYADFLVKYDVIELNAFLYNAVLHYDGILNNGSLCDLYAS